MIDFGKIFRQLSMHNIRKLYYAYKVHGAKYVLFRLNVLFAKKDYQKLYLKEHLPNANELKLQRELIFEYMPLISIVVPTYNTPKQYLIEMLDSVINQSYINWELCIADGASQNSDTLQILHDYANLYDNIKIIYLKENYHISGNTNMALDLVTGDYIAFLDHDDILAPNCLFEYVKVINDSLDNKPALLYCDEDKIDSNGSRYYDPFYKSDFSIDYLRSNNYIMNSFILKTSVINKISDLDSELDYAMFYDVILRVFDLSNNIEHLDKVLYHRRENNDIENTHIYDKKVIEEHLLRNNIKAVVNDGFADGFYKINYQIKGEPLISIIIPNKDAKTDLEKCINSIYQKSTYKNFEIFIVENNSMSQEIFNYYNELEAKYSNLKVLEYPESGFNYSKINNYAVQYTNGEHLLLLNNDTEVIAPNWMEELLMYSQRSDVGAVGAKLFYPDETIQHVGVIFGNVKVAEHLGVGQPREYNGHFGRYGLVQRLHAVTAACLMVKKSAYLEVHGLNEELAVAFNDVDFCLKLEKHGYANIINPDCQLYHYESKSRGFENDGTKIKRYLNEIDIFVNKWGSYRQDIYYPQYKFD